MRISKDSHNDMIFMTIDVSHISSKNNAIIDQGAQSN